MKAATLGASALLAVFFPLNASAQAHEARITSTTRTVTVHSADEHAARVGETLTEGHRVRTGDDGAVTVALHGGATLALGEDSEAQLYGDPSARVSARQPPSRDTILRRGRAVLTAGSGAVTLATPSCTIVLQRGEATVRVERSRVTRVSVTRGRARVRGAGPEVALRDNMGARAELGSPPIAHALVAAPVWTVRPAARTFTLGAPVPAQGTFGPAPRNATAAVRWRVQVGRDEGFRDVMRDETQPAAQTQWRAASLAPGRYWVRVRGIDSDALEGSWSAAAAVQIAGPRVVPGADGHVATVEVPEGLFCGLDSSPIAPIDRAITLVPGRSHRLRCALDAAGTGAIESVISAADCGPLRHALQLASSSSGAQRVLGIRLTDARGVGVPYATLRVSAERGVRVETIREAPERGSYEATMVWPTGVARTTVHVEVNGEVRFDEELRAD